MSIFRHSQGPYAGLVEVTGRIVQDRRLSLLLVGKDQPDAWLPKSQVRIVAQNDRGEAAVAMPPWLAAEKGFISHADAGGRPKCAKRRRRVRSAANRFLSRR